MKKLILGLAIAASFNTITALASDPLENFPTGEWKGNYQITNCANPPSPANGTAHLIVTNPVYKPDAGYGSQLNFGGSFQLDNFPTINGVPDFSQKTNLNPATTRVKQTASGQPLYDVFLTPEGSSSPAFGSSAYGYDPSEQLISVFGSAGGNCDILMRVTAPASSH